MKGNRQVVLISLEITIRGEDGDIVSRRYGADDKVGIRALNPVAATEIEESSGGFVIAGCYLKIGKCPQMFAEFPELRLVFDSREEFLSYRSDYRDPHLVNQLDQFG